MTSGAATAGYLAHQRAAGAHLPWPISAASCTPRGRMLEVVIIEGCMRTDARSWGGREKEAQGRGGFRRSRSARVPGGTWRTGQQGKGSIKAPWGVTVEQRQPTWACRPAQVGTASSVHGFMPRPQLCRLGGREPAPMSTTSRRVKAKARGCVSSREPEHGGRRFPSTRKPSGRNAPWASGSQTNRPGKVRK